MSTCSQEWKKFYEVNSNLTLLPVTSHFFHSLDTCKLNSNIIYLCDVIFCFITPSRVLIAGNVFYILIK